MVPLVLVVATLQLTIIAPGTDAAADAADIPCTYTHAVPILSCEVTSADLQALRYSQAYHVLQRQLLGPPVCHLRDVPSSVTPWSTQTLTTPL